MYLCKFVIICLLLCETIASFMLLSCFAYLRMTVALKHCWMNCILSERCSPRTRTIWISGWHRLFEGTGVEKGGMTWKVHVSKYILGQSKLSIAAACRRHCGQGICVHWQYDWGDWSRFWVEIQQNHLDASCCNTVQTSRVQERKLKLPSLNLKSIYI